MSSINSARTSIFLSLLVAFFLLPSLPAAAQEATATIGGTVRDQSGAVLPRAAVTLTNSQTGISRQTTAGPDGNYLFTLVPIGTYDVAAEARGFSKFVHTGIVLDINQNARQDIVLQVGATTQTVEVSGNVSQVDTVSATLGKVETERRILDLPLVGRDTLQLRAATGWSFRPGSGRRLRKPFLRERAALRVHDFPAGWC